MELAQNYCATGSCIGEDTPYSLRAGMGIFIYPRERYIFKNCDEYFGQFFCHFNICGNENTASPDIFRTEVGNSRIVESRAGLRILLYPSAPLGTSPLGISAPLTSTPLSAARYGGSRLRNLG